MAVHELRRFNFFDLNKDSDNGAIAKSLKDNQPKDAQAKDVELKVATSGHGNFILGDSEGYIYIFNRNFKATTFKGYTVNITLAMYVKHTPFLVTVGEDEVGVNPLLKVWNTEKIDKNGNPTCVRVTRLNPNHKAVQPTCVSIHEVANLLSVGFQDGSILLFRGDLARDRNNKPKLLKDSGGSMITGLAFRTSAKYSFLFVTSKDQVFFYDVSTKDKEIKISLDSSGCQLGCSIMAESPHGANFVVGGSNAVYCYTTDGKGPCYAVDGEKILIQWSKTYLVIVSKEESRARNALRPNTNESNSVSEDHVITILDIQNKLIVFSTTMKPILAVLVEWGCFYIITKDHKIHHLAEKDVQSKLSLLFKKNLYDVAIQMAKSQHYDDEGLVEIFKQYGDHLYTKGDRCGAIEQYKKTIGKLEPSYIIRKFMDSAHMEQLMEYLQALHRAGLANGDHTALLLNCYTKLKKTDDLKNFIGTKDRELDFDIEIALKVVRNVNQEDALQLAKDHGKHQWVLRILLEDQKKYGEAITYISQLQTSDAEKCMLEFGNTLINCAPEETTKFLKSFCTNGKSQTSPFGMLDTAPGTGRARPQDYLHLFLNKSEYLVEFLEHLVQSQSGWSTQIYNALVEHYLIVWSKSDEGSRSQVEQRLMKLLQNPDAMYDRDQMFILCQMYDFSPGIILLYEENKMYYQVVQYHVNQKNYKAALATCKKYGYQDPQLWIQALWSVAQDSDAPAHLLPDILLVIHKEKLLPPRMTLEAIKDTPATLEQARKYLMAILQAEEEIVKQETELIRKYSADTERIKSHIQDLQTNATIFQSSRCSVCQRQLELPSIHFLCQHSYHQHCFQSYSDNENECISCRGNNKQLLKMIQSQEPSHETHEAFHSQLEKSDDGFSVVADYFGRGVFNNLSIVNPEGASSLPSPVKPELKKPTELLPSRKEQTDQPKRSPAYDIVKRSASETLEANLIRTVQEKPIRNRMEISSAAVDPVDNKCNNPFEEEYDDTKNPFAEEDDDPTNPFSSDNDPSDYDKQLNPFA